MSNKYKLVPVEPTAEMVRAGMGVGDDNCLYWKHPRQAYIDMLAVAPQPPALGGDLVVVGTLHRDCDERIVFESSGEFHVKDGMPVYSDDSVAPLQAENQQNKELLKAYMNSEAEKGIELVNLRSQLDQLKARCDEQNRLLNEFHEVTTGGFLDSDHVLRLRRDLEALLSKPAGGVAV